MSQSLFSAGRTWISLAWKKFVQLLRIVWADRTLRFIFATLLAIDLCWTLWFGVAKFLYNTGINLTLYQLRYLRITEEGSWPERFNYVKTLVLVILLGYLARSTRQFIYLALTIVFTAVLLDDSLAIHERLGIYFARILEIRPMFGLRARDFGEVLTWAIFGVILVPLIVAGLARSERTHVVTGAALLVPFGAMLFCAIFMDQIYHVLKDAFFCCGILLDMIEDGGEMVTTTLALALAAALVKHKSFD